MASWAEQADAQIAAFFSSWNVYTTLLALAIGGLVIYTIVFQEEPDTHPYLLARQSRPSAVRQPRESAVYRAQDTPHGYPLRSGLNVKDAGASKWSAGRDGDLRDIWRAAVSGGEAGEKGLLLSVYGKEQAVEHNLEDISKEINAIGQHLQKRGSKVAIYLPNGVPFLSTVFASAFYGLSPILLPYNQPHAVVADLINATGADVLVAEAGSLPLEILKKTKVRAVTWVVEKASRHMDWTEKTAGVDLSAWHELVEQSTATADLPQGGTTPPGIFEVWLKRQGVPGRITEYSQANLVAGIAGLGIAIPQQQRIGTHDLVLPVDHFSNLYVLLQTCAALYSHASLAINSVAGPGVDIKIASRTVSPTIVIASAETLAALHHKETAGITSSMQRFAHVSQSQAMSVGRMPTDTLLFKLLGPKGNPSTAEPGRLRLILVSERAHTDAPPLSANTLSDLRIFTRARICYALTIPGIAGAVTQTNLYDYRLGQDPTQKYSHFGVPLSCCEVKLVSSNDNDVDGNTPSGEIVVSGPSVVGGSVRAGVKGKFGDDGTLAYA